MFCIPVHILQRMIEGIRALVTVRHHIKYSVQRDVLRLFGVNLICNCIIHLMVGILDSILNL